LTGISEYEKMDGLTANVNAETSTFMKASRFSDSIHHANNTADARRVFRGWADTLRGFLDSHYTK
jgi:hypothetical protein